MKYLIVFLAFISVLCAAVLILVSQNGNWQARQEKLTTEDFSKNQAAFEQLIDRWTILYPLNCGGPPPAPGLVADESIT